MPKLLTDKVRRLRRAQQQGAFVRDAKDELASELTTTSSLHKKLIKQHEEEYNPAWRFVRPKIQEGLIRLKLYNNQKRDKDKVGDPMVFALHQTLLAATQSDRLAVEFLGREEGDEDIGMNLTSLAEADYEEMDKFMHDMEWNWDTFAFGRGLSLFNDFDVDSRTPIATVLDPLTFVRDWIATSVNGNRLGIGALRFFGWEDGMTKQQMKDHGEYINLDKLKKTSETDPFSLVNEARQARRQAQGLETIAGYDSIGSNQEFRVRKWFTHIDGVKYLVEFANDGKLIVRVKEMVDKDGEPIKRWPLIDRVAYAMSHDWDGVSVFDIAEDKQRYRAALLNIFGDSARADLYPMRLYDSTKIKKEVDKNFNFNKWIPVNGPVGDAVQNLQPSGFAQKAQFILEFLDLSAQKALATSANRQGIETQGDKTLGELELVSAGSDARYSLTAKLFGHSEKQFWRRWYELYDEYYEKGIDDKIVRIVGTFGPTWRKTKRSDIITSNAFGPDIKVESRVVSEAKKRREYVETRDFMALAFQDQGSDKLYGLRKLGKMIMPKDEIERFLPLTFDELEAREENDLISDGKYVDVSVEQNHIVHLRMLAAAKENPQKKAHKKAHEYMLLKKRVMPEVFPVLPEEMAQQQDLKKGGGAALPSRPAPEGAATTING